MSVDTTKSESDLLLEQFKSKPGIPQSATANQTQPFSTAAIIPPGTTEAAEVVVDDIKAGEPAIIPPADNAPADLPKQTTQDTVPPATQPVTTGEVDDEKIFAQLSKQLGRTIKSYEDLKAAPEAPKVLTEDEKRKAAEQKRGNAIEFGKRYNFFDQSKYDQFIQFNVSDKADIVQDVYVAEAIKNDPTLTDEDARDQFNEAYHILEDQDSAKYKASQRLIEKQFEEIKKERFGKILNIESDYDRYLAQEEKGKAYTAHVDSVFANHLPSSFEFEIEGEKIPYPIDKTDTKLAEEIKAIRNGYLNIDMLNAYDLTSEEGKKEFQQMVTNDIKLLLFDRIVQSTAKTLADLKASKVKAGRKGVVDLAEQVTDPGKTGVVIPMGESDRLVEEFKKTSGFKK